MDAHDDKPGGDDRRDRIENIFAGPSPAPFGFDELPLVPVATENRPLGHGPGHGPVPR
jgi:hypothetical protein